MSTAQKARETNNNLVISPLLENLYILGHRRLTIKVEKGRAQ
jgi:hypothetical protein